MKPTRAQRTSAALARVAAAVTGERGKPKTRGSASRTHILAILHTAENDMTVEELAEESGLHPNTVRGHIDVLAAGGHVERTQTEPHGRGRPRLAYRAVPNPDSPYTALSASLTEALDTADNQELARRAADRWAETLDEHPKATSPDEAVENAAIALRGVGFTADVSPLGDSIALGNCPYASLVQDHPIICSIHTELLENVLEDSGQPVSVEAMDVWVKPGVCRARLSREDLNPAWSTKPIEEPPSTTVPPAKDD